jgi:hypothetical protein
MASVSSKPVCRIREGSWKDFRLDVKHTDPELFNIIEKISPNQEYQLMEVTYFYGEKITDLGTICLPDEHGNLYRLEDLRLPNRYREQLGYCPTPLILQLSRGSEAFIDTGERIIPLNVFLPGDLYGLFEAIMPLTDCPISPCWSVTAGARSVFLGAKVSDALGHKRLRAEYSVTAEPPKRLIDEWDVIKKIGNHERGDDRWTCKILIFTKKWLEKRDDDLGWTLFHNHLLIKSWIQSKLMRGKSELSIMLEAFASTIRNRNLKPNSYVLDTIMHNMYMANNAAPGFKSADTEELLLPSLAVEKAYEHVYLLKEYAPIVMHPWRTRDDDDLEPIYYSLSYPTLLEGTPSIRHAPSMISEIRQIKMLTYEFKKIFSQHGSLTYKSIENIAFEYFHNEKDMFDEITNSIKIIDTDLYLQRNIARFPNRVFPYNGTFFRGCIRLSKK